MKFKKIYIEITNICNLKCSFCSKSNKPKKEMTSEEFRTILNKINNYTDYIYLHVKGEPLTHHHLEDILDIAEEYQKKVCITTNGVFLKEKIDILKKYNNIYQINISLHSENNKENYLSDIIDSVNTLKSPYISYRFWTLDNNKMDNKTKEYINILKKEYKLDKVYSGIKLKDKVYLSLDNKFTWPSLNNNYYEDGYCLGGKSQLAVLVDGSVSICCLDSEGLSDLGNIYQNSLEEILNTKKYKETVKAFNNNKAYLEICKHCTYKEKFKK